MLLYTQHFCPTLQLNKLQHTPVHVFQLYSPVSVCREKSKNPNPKISISCCVFYRSPSMERPLRWWVRSLICSKRKREKWGDRGEHEVALWDVLRGSPSKRCIRCTCLEAVCYFNEVNLSVIFCLVVVLWDHMCRVNNIWKTQADSLSIVELVY